MSTNVQEKLNRSGCDRTRSRRKVLCVVLALVSTVPEETRGGTSVGLLAPEEVVARMEQRNEEQWRALRSYQARRRYSAEQRMLDQPAFLLVEENYRAPEEKELKVLQRSGPAILERQLFSRLLETELETARGPARLAVELCRRNYQFTFQQYDRTAGAYVFQAEPRTANPYLLRGKIWVNAEDFAVQRMEGEPAQRHSFWIRESRFVHEFAKFGDFWFPVRHRSEADLRMFGKATLEIVYFDYHWQTRRQEPEFGLRDSGLGKAPRDIAEAALNGSATMTRKGDLR